MNDELFDKAVRSYYRRFGARCVAPSREHSSMVGNLLTLAREGMTLVRYLVKGNRLYLDWCWEELAEIASRRTER